LATIIKLLAAAQYATASLTPLQGALADLLLFQTLNFLGSMTMMSTVGICASTVMSLV
jgi:hypothetical protein